MNEEIWKDIAGYEGLYQVSTMGRVKSLDKMVRNGIGKSNGDSFFLRKGAILGERRQYQGYISYALYKESIQKCFFGHRLVGLAFMPNPENKPQINHINEVKNDNRLENLGWVTNKENSNHGNRNYKLSKALTNGKNSKKIIQLTMDGKFIKEWPSFMEAGRNGFATSNIHKVCMGKRNHHKGFKWAHA